MSTLPRIHLNGTSAKELLQQAQNAGSALRRAYEVCSNAAPNGRDYYPQAGALAAAQSEHVVIMKALSDAIEHYEAIAEHAYEHDSR
jgi:hypothetical protein